MHILMMRDETFLVKRKSYEYDFYFLLEASMRYHSFFVRFFGKYISNILCRDKKCV